MNWGYKILTVYIIFLAGMIFMVFKSSVQNQDLVTSDYYEQELKYQQRIDEATRANSLSADVKYELNEKGITLFFPVEMNKKKLTAHVLLYCAADKNRDKQQDLSTENAQMNFTIPAGNKGAHKLKINWTANATNYYNELKIMIP
ncbi:hypothetical protein BH11BAC4_BH11BAC4_21220 [soil metagenome]